MKSTQPDKLCKRCGNVTRRAPDGECVPCANKRRRARRAAFRMAAPKPGLAHTETLATIKRRATAAGFRHKLPEAQRYLVTAAQNATPVHEGFLASLQTYAKANEAEIVVLPFRYRNPTSRFSKEGDDTEWWADELEPYLFAGRANFGHIGIMGDIKTAATATKPLAGKDALSHGQSGIFGHPKLQLKTVPTPQGSYPKINTTTGACTHMSYSDTALGAIGEFHHTMGAALLEFEPDGKTFHLRQINADDKGEFDDIDRHYAPGAVSAAARSKAICLGDWHKDFTLPSVEHATFGPGGMVEVLRPEVIAWHDLADMYSVNHHHRGNFIIANAKAESGRVDARAEVERACQYVLENTPKGCLSVIVPSNHNDFLSRWMLETDPRTLVGANFDLWCETALAMKRSAKSTLKGTEYIDAFVYWARRFFAGCPNVRVLERGESFTVADVELGLHFDRGPNGARGSLQNLRRIGVKVMGGHGHGPGIDEGGYQVGTATGQLEYAIGGPSGWLNTHGVIYGTGKRSLLNIIGNNWRA